MNDMHVGRNDLCPCGSGKKFKKCCLQARSSFGAVQPARFAQHPARSSFAVASAGSNTRSGPPRQLAGAFDHIPANAEANEPDAPATATVPLLPVEVGLHYTFPEPFGLAEVTFIFPGGKIFVTETEQAVPVENLKPGDRVVLQDDQIATITAVKLYYEPPEPPTLAENGRVLSRVIGTIKHKGPAVIDVKWPGYTATSSPEHPYFSVSRQTYVPANELQVGELLRTDDNLVTPVQNVSEPRYGLIDLYNIEVEHFHNYYVGSGEGNSVLVHNGASAAGGYINTPKDAFKVGKHGEMPAPRPGQQSHHGAMSAWMKKNYPGYDPAKAPAVLMPEANHRATFGVYNTWRAEMKAKMGGTFDWGNVSYSDMRSLSRQMFDAAGVPGSVRQQYWREFRRMIAALER